MKRIAIAVLAIAPLLLPVTPALGQTVVALTGGWNLASLALEIRGDDASPRSITRHSIGLAATIPMSERLGLYLGGTYSEKGAVVRDRALGFLFQGALEIDYLELSVLGMAKVLESDDGVVLHFLVGPAVATQASCKWNTKLTSEDETVRERRTDCPDNTASSFDFGVAGGGLLEMWISDRLGISLSALHTRGLLDIDEGSEDYTMRNRTWSLRTGILFSIG